MKASEIVLKHALSWQSEVERLRLMEADALWKATPGALAAISEDVARTRYVTAAFLGMAQELREAGL